MARRTFVVQRRKTFRAVARALGNGTRRCTTCFAGSQDWQNPSTPGGRSVGCTKESSSTTTVELAVSYFTSAVAHNSHPPPAFRTEQITSRSEVIFLMLDERQRFFIVSGVQRSIAGRTSTMPQSIARSSAAWFVGSLNGGSRKLRNTATAPGAATRFTAAKSRCS